MKTLVALVLAATIADVIVEPCEVSDVVAPGYVVDA